MSGTKADVQVVIVGGGIAGLAFALSLHQAGVSCRVYDAARELRPLGVGINLLPHAVKELDELGLVPALDAVGIRTLDASYFNRFGQHIYTEPAGEAAGYPWPQFSIHRGDLQMALLEAVLERLGEDGVVTGHRCIGVDTTDDRAAVHFVGPDSEPLASVQAAAVVGCDGIHSAIRKQLYPDEGGPIYSGLTIWRGSAPLAPILSGANTARIGWMSVGKLMVYPVRDNVDAAGRQLMNFVATLERPVPDSYDWNAPGRLEDFFEPYADWNFDWFSAPELLKSADPILVFPMVDRDPVTTWTRGRVTLMGDAAHPMYPRGSNGAGQAILDARFLAGCFKRHGVNAEALGEYDKVRVEATARVVRMNRADPPDAILREIHERCGDRPFDKLENVISHSELAEIANRYRTVSGSAIEQLRHRPSFV